MMPLSPADAASAARRAPTIAMMRPMTHWTADSSTIRPRLLSRSTSIRQRPAWAFTNSDADPLPHARQYPEHGPEAGHRRLADAPRQQVEHMVERDAEHIQHKAEHRP